MPAVVDVRVERDAAACARTLRFVVVDAVAFRCATVGADVEFQALSASLVGRWTAVGADQVAFAVAQRRPERSATGVRAHAALLFRFDTVDVVLVVALLGTGVELETGRALVGLALSTEAHVVPVDMLGRSDK